MYLKKKINQIYLLSKLDIVHQFQKFFIIGLGSTTVNYLVFFIFFYFLEMFYLYAGLIGFFSGAFFSYYFNKKWTFKSNVAFFSGFYKFILAQILNFLIHSSMQYTSVNLLDISEVFSQLFGIIFSMIFNFTILKKIIFKDI